jgi:uncharacterized protein
MRVVGLWRFPVKSLQGERIEEAELGAEGIEGDRRYAFFDVDTGYGLTARRAPEMLFTSTRTTPDGAVEILLPDGTVAADDAALSAWLGGRAGCGPRRTSRIGDTRIPRTSTPRLRCHGGRSS